MVKIIVREELCTGCGACIDACPKSGRIWELVNENNRVIARVKDESFCLYCTTCITRCKANAIEIRL